MIVVGIDPGFAKLGWARASGGELQLVGLITTEGTEQPGRKKGKRSKIDRADDARRAREIYSGLLPILAGADLVFVEEPGGMRDAGAAAKIGIAWGAVAAAVHRSGARWMCAKPDVLKHSIGLPRDASKLEVLEKVCTFPGFGRLPELLGACRCKVKRKPDGTPRNGQWEHPSDAAAAAFAGIKALEVRA